MSSKDVVIEQLKQIIIDQKMQIVKLQIPHGHCPYAYFTSVENEVNECNDCNKCKLQFYDKYRKMVTDKVKEM